MSEFAICDDGHRINFLMAHVDWVNRAIGNGELLLVKHQASMLFLFYHPVYGWNVSRKERR